MLVLEMRYDARGRLVEEFYLDPADHPAANSDGFAKTKYSYDERGQRAQESYVDASDHPVINRKERAAAIRFRYDESGRERTREYLDLDGRVLRQEPP